MPENDSVWVEPRAKKTKANLKSREMSRSIATSRKLKCSSSDYSDEEYEMKPSRRKISINSDRTKVAPRSTLQYKIGPEFSDTLLKRELFDIDGNEITPVVFARIDRGIIQEDRQWIGYKRNYFSVVASYNFNPETDFNIPETPMFLKDKNGIKIRISYFALRLRAMSCDEREDVPLIQHTAKRDKGPRCAPPIFPCVPAKLPTHDTVVEASNARNKAKIEGLNREFWYPGGNNDINRSEFMELYPKDKIARVARYERVQFSAPPNSRKGPSNCGFSKLQVELTCYLPADECFICIALLETPPLIIRGRSPSSYNSDGSTPPQVVTRPITRIVNDSNSYASFNSNSSSNTSINIPSEQITHRKPLTDKSDFFQNMKEKPALKVILKVHSFSVENSEKIPMKMGKKKKRPYLKKQPYQRSKSTDLIFTDDTKKDKRKTKFVTNKVLNYSQQSTTLPSKRKISDNYDTKSKNKKSTNTRIIPPSSPCSELKPTSSVISTSFMTIKKENSVLSQIKSLHKNVEHTAKDHTSRLSISSLLNPVKYPNTDIQNTDHDLKIETNDVSLREIPPVIDSIKETSSPVKSIDVESERNININEESSDSDSESSSVCNSGLDSDSDSDSVCNSETENAVGNETTLDKHEDSYNEENIQIDFEKSSDDADPTIINSSIDRSNYIDEEYFEESSILDFRILSSPSFVRHKMAVSPSMDMRMLENKSREYISVSVPAKWDEVITYRSSSDKLRPFSPLITVQQDKSGHNLPPEGLLKEDALGSSSRPFFKSEMSSVCETSLLLGLGDPPISKNVNWGMNKRQS